MIFAVFDNFRDTNQITCMLNDENQQLLIMSYVNGSKSALYNCLVTYNCYCYLWCLDNYLKNLPTFCTVERKQKPEFAPTTELPQVAAVARQSGQDVTGRAHLLSYKFRKTVVGFQFIQMT